MVELRHRKYEARGSVSSDEDSSIIEDHDFWSSLPVYRIELRSKQNELLQQASGFAIAPGIVLTAAHAVRCPGFDDEVCVWLCALPNVELEVTDVTAHAHLDLCLLRVPHLPKSVAWPWMVRAFVRASGRSRHDQLVAIGYASKQPTRAGRCLVSWPQIVMHAMSQGSQFAQISGGLPHGFSGGPVVWLGDHGHALVGMVQLGGDRSVVSQFVVADAILEWLSQIGGIFVPLASAPPRKRARWSPKFILRMQRCGQVAIALGIAGASVGYGFDAWQRSSTTTNMWSSHGSPPHLAPHLIQVVPSERVITDLDDMDGQGCALVYAWVDEPVHLYFVDRLGEADARVLSYRDTTHSSDANHGRLIALSDESKCVVRRRDPPSRYLIASRQPLDLRDFSQMDPKQMNPKQMNPKQMNPKQMDPKQMNPKKLGDWSKPGDWSMSAVEHIRARTVHQLESSLP